VTTDRVPVTTEIRKRINASPVVAMDETGWHNNGEWWVRLATTEGLTYYNVAVGRGPTRPATSSTPTMTPR
jgi:hypothetical protein